MKFICFGSGSSGNSYYLESQGQAILIDLGVGIRAFKRHLKDYGVRIPAIQAIFVTHDHADHIKAVGIFSIEQKLPVYAAQAVHEGMLRNRYMTKKVPVEQRRLMQAHVPIEVGNFRITPFPVPHDASANNGYFVELLSPETVTDAYGNVLSTSDTPPSFCLVTDCGRFTPEIASYVQRTRYLVIEANYDAQMLAHGPYPPFLQERISCGTGHLENRFTADALAQHLTPTTRHIWLCHLSAENNTPTLALDTVQEGLSRLDFPAPQVEVLRRTLPTGPVELR